MFQGHADADDDQLEDDLANAELVDEADYAVRHWAGPCINTLSHQSDIC